MRTRRLLLILTLAALPVALAGQGPSLAPSKLLEPLADEWPTYSGDYSG